MGLSEEEKIGRCFLKLKGINVNLKMRVLNRALKKVDKFDSKSIKLIFKVDWNFGILVQFYLGQLISLLCYKLRQK